MILSFMTANELHAVHVIHQQGLTKIRAKGLCAVDEDAGSGIYQVPDWAFDGRRKYGDTPVCVKCAGIAAAKKEPPR